MNNLDMNNPALRLHDILEKGMKHDPRQKTKDVWKSILEVEDDFHLFGKISAVQLLVTEIVCSFERYDPVNYKRYCSWLPQLETAFNQQNLNGDWNTFKSFINQNTLDGISTSALAMSHFSNSKKVSEENLLSLRKHTNCLIEELKSSDLESDIRLFILDHLYSILRALDEYKIKGPEYLIEKIERAAGSAAIKANTQQIPKAKFHSFMNYIANAATIVGLCNSVSDFTGLESPTDIVEITLNSLKN
ncbi:hypothetical protein MAQ5080_02159 [Marinomonas aquimarina]|uniref:Uncharacterized protein n=1 Tax=Marinomonas aquimarina TaxID=295068 RepID=A0A1A8TG51_9GAMM|nr:hypothetical protein [Marinomonas aquimarina]SBS32077.1 hypothetical protein MAQ5080_02159 [Marinomonas aquimarina]